MKIGDKVIFKKKSTGCRTISYGAYQYQGFDEGTKGVIYGYAMNVSQISVDIGGQTWDIDVVDIELDEHKPSGKSWKEQGLCPVCGKDGIFISLGLVCQQHGLY